MARIIFPRVVLLGLLVALFGITAAEAQIFGIVRGTVVDPQGLAIPGAGITITAQTSAFEQKTQTNERGQFIMAIVPVGLYTIQIEQTGFEDISQPLEVRVGVGPDLRFTMKIDPDDLVILCDSAPIRMDSYGKARIGRGLSGTPRRQ